MENNQLYHHGILGMKWGRRRYQNKDGSLTAAGKKRYGDSSDDGESAKKSTKKKSVSEMTDDELRKSLDRARMETQYMQLRPDNVSRGKKFVRTVGTKVVAQASINAGEKLVEKILMKTGDVAVNKFLTKIGVDNT